MLLLSRFSRVRLCATPWTAAHQAPPSLGFSRQEYGSVVPLPSPTNVKKSVYYILRFLVFFFSFPQMMLLDKSGYFCSDIAQHLYMVHVEIMIKD